MSLALKTYNTLDQEVIYSHDFYLHTKDKKYIDMQSGIWCTILGHQPDFMKDIITKQLKKTIHLHSLFTPKIVDQLTNKLNHLAGINGKGIFLSSGSEAVALAIRIGTLHGKRKLTFKNAYLSVFEDLQKREDDTWFEIDYMPCLSCERKCHRACDVLNLPIETIDAFILESFHSGTAYHPPQKMIDTLLKHFTEDTKIVANEITTGICRTGKWFGYQHYGIKPDVIAMGKGLGNGYPVSCVLVDESLAESVDFHYIQSHQNDPLGLNIAYSVLDELDKGDYLTRSQILHDCLVEHIPIDTYDSVGMLFSLKLNNEEQANQVWKALLEAGYFTGHSAHVIHLAPSLTITKQVIIDFCKTLERILNETITND